MEVPEQPYTPLHHGSPRATLVYTTAPWKSQSNRLHHCTVEVPEQPYTLLRHRIPRATIYTTVQWKSPSNRIHHCTVEVPSNCIHAVSKHEGSLWKVSPWRMMHQVVNYLHCVYKPGTELKFEIYTEIKCFCAQSLCQTWSTHLIQLYILII